MKLSGTNITFSNVETHIIKSIDFGLMNPEEILKLSVCKIDQTQVTDPDGKPSKGGVNDIRLGTVDKSYNCETCGSNFTDCAGHFGHIELVKPVFHVGFIETCKRIMRCICFNCSKLLIQKGTKFKEIIKNKNPKKRQTLMFGACKSINQCKLKEEKGDDDSTGNSSCDNDNILHDGCGYIQPIYKKDKNDPLKIVIEFKDDNEDNLDRQRFLSADECLRIFRKISREDCFALGFDPSRSRPDWMIINYLAVCPPQVRPSVSFDSTLRSEDDLTYQYVQILKANSILKKQEEQGAAGHIIAETAILLQFYVATLMHNELSSAQSTHKNGRPIKALSTRLKGKEGRIRGNLMGKRVDFSARSVITPDPNLSLDELGVPTSIAMNLTVPEYVTSHNIESLRVLVEKGPLEWPGAKYLIRDDGVRIDLRYIKKRSDIHLAIGYIVERHIQNGDFVLFNRQPSLHKMSIMGHRVRVLPYSTFKLNLSVTTPYNADFDGDEMNMHLPQSMETKAEIVEIMHVPRQIISPQSNRPVMGIVQDALIGVKLFTHRDTFITYDHLMNLFMWISDFDGDIPIPAILKPLPLWTGKQIFSKILPKVHLNRYTSDHNDKKFDSFNLYDTKLLIESGELLMGIVCKRTVGNSSGGLIHCIFNEFGPMKTMWFLNHTQRIINQWLLSNGFTVGISDTITENSTNQKIKETMDEAKEKCKNNLIEAQKGNLECQPGKSMLESFEAKVNATLNEARDTAGRYVQNSLKNNNHLKNMVIAGSKGNITNISQIMACVGQQNVEGKRIPFYFNKRTLPHFTKDDLGPESRGFVENSYLSGLTPQEFFFHAMGGREGLIDTAVKTSETGYIQRRLVKALEDIMVKYDGTVRNSLGHIIQFLYGEDGVNGELIEDQKLETLLLDNEKMIKKYKFFEDEEINIDKITSFLQKYLDPDVILEIFYSERLPNIKLKLDEEYENIKKTRDEIREFVFKNGDDKQHFPVNIPRIIWNAKKIFGINQNTISNLHPLYVLERVEHLKKSLILVQGNDKISQEAQLNSTMLFNSIINYNLASKRIILHERFTVNAFDYVIGEIENRFFQSLARPGEMVGSIAAQSIGEPSTQMTLNTFHFAGVSSKNVTLGVPRLKEIINVAKTLKTPSMTVFLKKDFVNSEMHAKKLQTMIEHTNMMNVTIKSEIFYDPDPRKTIIEEDAEMVDIDAKLKFSDDEILLNRVSPWVLRIELDSNLLIDKNLTMSFISDKIEENYKSIDINSSDENADNLIIRIRIIYDALNERLSKVEAHSQDILKNFENVLLRELSLKGIPQIRKVYVKQGKRQYFDNTSGAFITDGKSKEWVIETDGTNISEIFHLEDVDFTRTITNDLNEIYECLGIEAVRKSLINELRAVLRPYDVYVNYRHIAILCDVMTQRGSLTAITRHGINRVELGPLRKCSFEETVDILLEAGLFSETDHLTGITENIMVGQLAPFGTGCFDVLLDMDKVLKIKDSNEENLKNIQDEEDLYYNSPNSVCSPSHTPYLASPNNDGNQSIYNPSFTPAGERRQTINFTPLPEYGKSPSYNMQKNNNYIVNITTPNPYMSPQNLYSPNANAMNSEYVPYSPVDYENPLNSAANSNFNDKDMNSPNPMNSEKYSPSNFNSKSPFNNTSYRNSSPNMVSYNRLCASSYLKTYSPVGNSEVSSAKYSPIGGKNYSIKSSNYSGNINSPNVVNSMSSQNYSPRSPTYNPKSPSYNNIIQSMHSQNSPFYSSYPPNTAQNFSNNEDKDFSMIEEEEEEK